MRLKLYRKSSMVMLNKFELNCYVRTDSGAVSCHGQCSLCSETCHHGVLWGITAKLSNGLGSVTERTRVCNVKQVRAFVVRSL